MIDSYFMLKCCGKIGIYSLVFLGQLYSVIIAANYSLVGKMIHNCVDILFSPFFLLHDLLMFGLFCNLRDFIFLFQHVWHAFTLWRAIVRSFHRTPKQWQCPSTQHLRTK